MHLAPRKYYLHFTYYCCVIVLVGSFIIYLGSIESQAPGTWEMVVVGLGRGRLRVAESTDRAWHLPSASGAACPYIVWTSAHGA